MKLLVRPGLADIAAKVAPDLVTVGLRACITIPLPARIAALLPEPQPGVLPHITLVGPAPVRLEQVQHLRGAFSGRSHSPTLHQLKPFTVRLRGVGDFRRAATPTDVVFLEIADGAAQLAELAACVHAEFRFRKRKYKFHPHATLGHNKPDPVLDQLAEQFADFDDEFMVTRLTVTTAHGPLDDPSRGTWHQPQHYALI